ncbi:serine protease inhibitor [Cenarchaeum symbiosum A]|uniref:Serine protease inhibitor n=1 Tax=Cenarchaeum symbiosum (strain A) TaxID=414004 RepID=A0RZ04_CENSY|nr:serine protease inhibitor [Cenarchaeum symbiosum A]
MRVIYAAPILLLLVPAAGALQCGEEHVLTERPNGKLACVTDQTADRLGWMRVQDPGDPADRVSPDGLSVMHERQPVEAPALLGIGADARGMTDADARGAAGNRSFAGDFYAQVSDIQGNIFFSPVSIHTAFSAVYEGAEGDTAAQLRDAFGLEPDDSARHASVKLLLESFGGTGPVLEMASALWLADWIEAKEEYVGAVRDVYRSDVERIDFVSEGEKRIDAWASDNTRGRITDVTEQDQFDDLTAAVITNVVYFNGSWAERFSVEDTRTSTFWRGASDGVDAEFMNLAANLDYSERRGAQVLRLPYEGGGISMVIILPGTRDGITELEQSVVHDGIPAWTSGMASKEVMVSLPKFEMGTRYDLVPLLSGLGVLDAFVPSDADFAGIADVAGELYIGGASHDAYVRVNEAGTEAAAATVVGMRATSEPPPPEVFTADHPFLFIIQDDGGAVLFMGRLSDPTA